MISTHKGYTQHHGILVEHQVDNCKQTILVRAIQTSALCQESFSSLVHWASLALRTSLPAASSLLPGISGCQQWGCLELAWECQHLQSPGELREDQLRFCFLLSNKGAEMPPRAYHPVFGLEGTQSWSQ